MIGFDIGTTRCKIASVDPSGKAFIISNARGEHTTPSVVYVPASGDPLIGRDAIEQGAVDPRRCIRNFKLDLGGTQSLLQDGMVLTPTDATATLISALKKDAETALGVEVTEAVATCPANFRDDAKQALLEAFERNGVEILRLMPEPTAAGFAYAPEKAPNDARLLVCDIGGGTTDVSVIQVSGSQITVLATEGVPRLGGNDFSQCIKERVLNDMQAKCGEQPAAESEQLFYLDLEQRVETAKASLAKQKEIPIVVGYKGQQLIVRITQDEYHRAIAPLIEQILDALDRAVEGAGLKFDQIYNLLLVGGASRSPFVQEKLAEHTGIIPRTDIDPEKAIAYGAALASVAEMARQGKVATLRGQVIPAPDAFICDVTAHDVGCAVIDASKGTKKIVNAIIVPKNTRIPCQRTDRFGLEHEQQTQAQIEILQGEADADRDDCLLIGELLLENLPVKAQRTKRIQMEYVIDANGMVTVTATDEVSKRSKTVSVDYKKGIKPKDGPAAA